MPRIVGETKSAKRSNPDHKRFKVGLRLKGAKLPNFRDFSAGMLFPTSDAAETWFQRTLDNLGYEIPKGAVITAEPAKER